MNDDGPEIVLNLWYVRDQEGFIYSLRARAYVASGNSIEKTTFLKTHADVDYLIARSFEVPEVFCSVTLGSGRPLGMRVSHIAVLDATTSPVSLWEKAIKQLDAEIPSQTHLQIPKSPVVCITPLLGRDDGEIGPFYDAVQRY